MITIDRDVDLRRLISILRTEERHLTETIARREEWKSLRITGILGFLSFKSKKEKERSIRLLTGIIKDIEERIARLKKRIEAEVNNV